MTDFAAVLLERDGEGATHARLARLGEADLMAGDVTLAVRASAVNFKDGLAVTGRQHNIDNAVRVRCERSVDLTGGGIERHQPRQRNRRVAALVADLGEGSTSDHGVAHLDDRVDPSIHGVRSVVSRIVAD